MDKPPSKVDSGGKFPKVDNVDSRDGFSQVDLSRWGPYAHLARLDDVFQLSRVFVEITFAPAEKCFDIFGAIREYRIGATALEATQGHTESCFSQLSYKCYLEEVSFVADGLEICPWVASGVEQRARGPNYLLFSIFR